MEVLNIVKIRTHCGPITQSRDMKSKTIIAILEATGQINVLLYNEEDEVLHGHPSFSSVEGDGRNAAYISVGKGVNNEGTLQVQRF